MKAAEKEARSSSPEGCKELLTESKAACSEVFTRGLEVNCYQLITGLQMGVKKAKGKLLKMDDADTDVKVANASCRVWLGTARRARAKQKDLPAASEAPAECQQLATALDTQCFAGFEKTETFGDGCGYVFRTTLTGKGPPQTSCGQLVKALDALNKKKK